MGAGGPDSEGYPEEARMSDDIQIIAYETADPRAAADQKWCALIMEKGTVWPIYALARSSAEAVAKLSSVAAEAASKRKARADREAARPKKGKRRA